MGIPRVKVLIEEIIAEGTTKKGGSELAKVVKITSGKGGFKLNALPEGSYTLTASKLGYNTEVVTIHVIHGEMCKVEIELAAD